MAAPSTALEEARLRADITQRELARLSGVSERTIQRAERGLRISGLRQQRLAKALEVPRAVLFPAETPEAVAS